MKRILIVEDELAYSQLLYDQLSAKGYEVSQAKDGYEGLELATKLHPDLIILDIKMPAMDGMTMLKLFRKKKGNEKVKVIMLTNLEPDRKIIEGTINEQPSYYFIKSDTKFIDLLKKIEELLAD